MNELFWAILIPLLLYLQDWIAAWIEQSGGVNGV